MRGSRNSQEKSALALRAELAGRLRERFPEIELAVLRRIQGLAEPLVDQDPFYADGLRSAARQALDYGIECMEQGPDCQVPMPPATARQARRAAREGVRLDTVLRRYVAGNKALEEFAVAEAEGVPSQVLCRILVDQGPQLDRLMAFVAAEFTDELERTKHSSVVRLMRSVTRLLAGDCLDDIADLGYELDIWHVGMVLAGRGATASFRAVAGGLDCRSLHVERDERTVWGWLGSTRQPCMAELERALAEHMQAETSLVIGEARRGLDGWRLTHHEAQVAAGVMLRGGRRFVRARDVLLLAGMLKDEKLTRSLLDSYLGPLEGHGNGEMMRETLRAYFSVDGNAAAAAARLGVTRHTVQRRIRTAEETIGRHLHSCHAELQVALQLEELQEYRRSGKL
jgi:hypothetical protein